MFSLANPRIIGHHNFQNAAAAVALGLLSDLTDAELQQGLDAYEGIPHRLERVGAAAGVTWWNDSKATNVDASVTALKSFSSGVHLIAGGLGKGSAYTPLVEVGRERIRAVYTIGQDAPLLRNAFAGSCEVVDCDTLERACQEAMARAQAGEHILLSPACASFDQFRDYGHRGDCFRQHFQAHAGAHAGEQP